MAFTTLAQIITAAKQRVSWFYTGTRSTTAWALTSTMGVAGSLATGTLAGTSTTTGVVPTHLTTGYPSIRPFGSGEKGYLVEVDFNSSLTGRISIFDQLWKGGAYAFNANTTGQTPTSYASRVPDGTDFTSCEIWLEQVTTATGIQNVAVTYTNESGVTGRSTGTFPTAANSVGRMWRLPLQSGDQGVQGVTGVVGSVATVGTFNILVMRRLWSGQIPVAGTGGVHGIAEIGLIELFQNSALVMVVQPDGAAIGVPEVQLTIVNG